MVSEIGWDDLVFLREEAPNNRLILFQGGSGASKTLNLCDEVAMENAHNICHNVQDLLYFRGFYWEGQTKRGKGKTRKRKSAKK